MEDSQVRYFTLKNTEGLYLAPRQGEYDLDYGSHYQFEFSDSSPNTHALWKNLGRGLLVKRIQPVLGGQIVEISVHEVQP